MTNIEWTNETWNPTTGCDRISPGCDNCYALTMAKRLKGMGSAKYQNDGDPRTSGPGFGITGHPDTLGEPLRWKKPRRVFVNSMSDLFHARVTTSLITDVWKIMAATPQHTYQILTKRASRLAPVLAKVHAELGLTEPLPNVWLGVSVENQKYADLRIPALLAAPAAIRFLSCEPLLGPAWIGDYVWQPCACCDGEGHDEACARCADTGCDSGHIRKLDWVIVGGESGPGARPMDTAWVGSLIKQCRDAGTAVFVKQLGSVWARDMAWGGKTVAGHGDTKGGTPDYWPTHLRVREYPTPA
ncbi:phage Gp37/Gp68 family protein [Streptomyces caniscabiei]|uniref:Phage Gp37/Gp68 family protein n=1 Tax=Streptomyces caniscabiei TaxID=2746961 RepID=A0ABU4MPN0_9ACTN|nr:phage Gp37/Gp68 family protein [Streptomyces caniscabiei]MBE4758365.1 phage Gp37/Gp68 family protein [Streptomyces caniscabiei]MBE4788456.1 phage Gp37/Gp68 family protein [Streptomyces caniscabiei]MDX2986404.1 phage Gp37/Gp68 family protein [Streptomyces caniscabiei]MDX3039408.1 phage Gp37/Gp68 family protein [Streptomyces caniscabiei]